MTVAVFDSSAVLAIVFGEPGADRAAALLDGGLISAVNHSEALAKMVEKGFAPNEAIDGLALLTLQVVAFDRPQAEATALLRTKTSVLGLSLGDRACLALAAGDRVAVTADRAWARLGLAQHIETIR